MIPNVLVKLRFQNILYFQDANIQGVQGHKEGTLTKEEFADFFKRISTREEVVDILKWYDFFSFFFF